MYVWLGIACILLGVVLWNNFRIQKERRNRNQKSFRKGYQKRKIEKE